jgi:bifunctional enzyme CysN/CysC
MSEISFRKKNTSGVIWVTGYSSSGKTTVARKLEAKLTHESIKVVFLDGDDLRGIFGRQWGYERQDRIELSKIYFRLCSHLASQGLTVVISAVSMFHEVRHWFKQNIPNAIEVYLDVPETVRVERDSQTKKLYQKKSYSSKYEEPISPDLVVKNYGDMDATKSAELIKEFYMQFGAINQASHGRDQHWNSFYKRGISPVTPSPFAEYVAQWLSPSSTLLEVGCGNGRDASFFASQGHQVVALDPSEEAITFCQGLHSGLTITFLSQTINGLTATHTEKFSHIYSRFCLHAMTKEEAGIFLAEASKLLQLGGNLFIECRSINDDLAREGEVISPTERIFDHYRRFIVLDELLLNLENNGFEVVESVESKGLAVYKNEDPVVIRVIANKL